MIGVPVGPGEEDVGDLRRDLLQLVRIYSVPGRQRRREVQIDNLISPIYFAFARQKDGTRKYGMIAKAKLNL